MEGLEAVETRFSSLKNIIDFRVESEYFLKKFQKIDAVLRGARTRKSTLIAKFINGFAFSSDEFNVSEDIRISKIGDVTNKRDPTTWEYVSVQEFQKQNADFLNSGDIVMSLTGDPPDVGKVNMVADYTSRMTWNQRVAKIEIIDEQLTNKNALYVLLSSTFCRTQLERYAKGIRQRNLGNDCFEFLKIPIISLGLQQQLSELVELSQFKKSCARTIFEDSETLILKTLGLTNFTPSTEAVNIKSFKDSFSSTGRLDAEYYQPKYEDWAQAIKAYKHGSTSVANACEVKDKNFTPIDDSTYSYIELSDIDKLGGITGATVATGEELPTRARRIVKQGDVLISSIEGSLISCAIVSEKYDGALCSTGFYVLHSEKINSETLLVLMKSTPIQALLKQGCSGTILTAINNEAFLNLPIPLIDMPTQQKIATQLQESFKLKTESERLLEVAKRAVEIAIEQDEAAGMNYIAQQAT